MSLKNCIDTLTDDEKNMKITRAVLGLGYNAIRLENGNVGLSANIVRERQGGCSVFKEAGTISGSRAGDVLKLGERGDLMSRSICLAVLNALTNTAESGEEGEVFDLVRVEEGDRVVMVGLIEPVAAMLKRKGCEVSVYEDRPVGHPMVEDPANLPARCAGADIIIITGTSLINDSFDEIMSHASRAREVVLMGPSTPMRARAFAGTPVSRLAGSRVTDPDLSFTIVMEGGGTRELLRHGAMVKIVSRV
ncbi:MAG TPA: DUF364 domain-containing protein [Spirochaetota bacterium]|nr:DUF364 domain-containing protein [Spirochaetota bacterium]